MRDQKPPSKWQATAGDDHVRRRLLFLVLALTFVRGVLYLSILPPWEHYDEPTHFEYLRLIADQNRLPRPGDYDLATRREIAASMRAAGFWKKLGAPPNDLLSPSPPWIGVSELEHPPLYYAALALAQRLSTHQGVEAQLYLARLTSVLLNLVVIAAAYALAAEVFPRRNMLPVVVAAFVAFLPPFTDLMSAVNNDAGAAAGVSLVLLVAARILRQGPSPRRIAVILLLTVACIATKSTAGVLALTVLAVLASSFVPPAWRRWTLAAGFLMLLVLPFAVLTWDGHAAHWLGHQPSAAVNRLKADAPLGHSVLALSAADQLTAGPDVHRHPRVLFQELNARDGIRLRGHPVTWGLWLKAPEGKGGTVALRLDDGSAEHWYQVQALDDWQFHAFTTTVRAEAPGVALYISLPKQEGAAGELLVDGVFLVDGQAAAFQPPQFDTAEAESGRWAGRPFTNLIRNGSAERAWPAMRPWVGDRDMYRYPIAHIFHSLWDWPRTGWVYRYELSNLFQGYWARFAWNQVALPGPVFYPLGLVTAAALVGCAVGLVRRRSRHAGIEQAAKYRGTPGPCARDAHLPICEPNESAKTRAQGSAPRWQSWAMAMLGMVLLVAWGSAILRIHPVLVTVHLYWPGARYASVAIVPSAMALCLGLAEFVPARWQRLAAWTGLLAIVALDTAALWAAILPYYYG